MTFLLENPLPVCNLHLTCGKGGHAVQLDTAFDAITCKAPTKGPTSSVIPADISTNPMADPPKAPRKVYAHNTVLTLVSDNFSLHYRSATLTLVRDSRTARYGAKFGGKWTEALQVSRRRKSIWISGIWTPYQHQCKSVPLPNIPCP